MAEKVGSNIPITNLLTHLVSTMSALKLTCRRYEENQMQNTLNAYIIEPRKSHSTTMHLL